MKHLNVVMLAGTVVVPKDSAGLILQRFSEETCKLVLRLRNVNGKKKAEGDQYAPSDFYNVAVWNKTAEWAQNNLHHGDLVMIRGHLAPNNYKDKTGRDVFALDIVADELERYTSVATETSASAEKEVLAQSYEKAEPVQKKAVYGDTADASQGVSSTRLYRGSLRSGTGAGRARSCQSAGTGGYMSPRAGYEV